MRPPDFLHTEAETNLCEHYIAAGSLCRLSTNDDLILEAARDTFLPVGTPSGAVDFSMRFWVDETDRSQPPWPKPYVRGRHHLVFAGFDEGNSILANLRKREVIGRFSPRMAADCTYYKTVIFPMLLTIISSTLGIAELHCACVEACQGGILLAGPSGAGKSTLALALSQEEFGFVSDDRTLCSLGNGQVYAWGLPTHLKLRHEAALWFQELQLPEWSAALSGMTDLWLEPGHLNRVKRVRRCSPKAVMFLDRINDSKFCLNRMSSAEALSLLARELMAELPDAAAKRSEVVSRIVELPCWLLQYGGQPQLIAREISLHLSQILTGP